jgi:hypothetical protein
MSNAQIPHEFHVPKKKMIRQYSSLLKGPFPLTDHVRINIYKSNVSDWVWAREKVVFSLIEGVDGVNAPWCRRFKDWDFIVVLEKRNYLPRFGFVDIIVPNTEDIKSYAFLWVPHKSQIVIGLHADALSLVCKAFIVILFDLVILHQGLPNGNGIWYF